MQLLNVLCSAVTLATVQPQTDVSAAVVAPPTTAIVAPSLEVAERVYYFSGTARVVSDITGKETWWPVGGSVTASNRSEALALARETGRARAAVFGRVISIDISLTN